MRHVGRVAIVTGGARGIGRAISDRLIAEGAAVAVFDRDEEALAGVESQLGLVVDIREEAAVKQAVEQVVGQLGPVGVLINNAGVSAYFDPQEMTVSQWDDVFAVDLKACWLMAKHVLPGMKSLGAGSIINIASIHSRMTLPGMFPYAAAKSGVIGLTRSLALDLAPSGIRVNSVSPGWTRTRLVEEWFTTQPDPLEAERGVLSVHPAGRMCSPEEIAAVVSFLASDDASGMIGTDVLVDAGLGARFAT